MAERIRRFHERYDVLVSKKKDLSKVTEPKAANLKLCVLAMLYAAANSKSVAWKDWKAVLDDVSWNEKVVLNWEKLNNGRWRTMTLLSFWRTPPRSFSIRKEKRHTSPDA